MIHDQQVDGPEAPFGVRHRPGASLGGAEVGGHVVHANAGEFSFGA